MATLPDYVRPMADQMCEMVRNVRMGGHAQGVDLSDLTDLEVLAILEWSRRNTPEGLDAAMTIVGMFATMAVTP